MHHVYSKCNAGRGIYLQCDYTGTRAQCETYLRHLRRAGRMTHFYFISKLDIGSATRRYAD